MPSDEFIHMKPAFGECEIHDWLTEGLAKRLVEAMRERHGKGGINACSDCLRRARDAARAALPAAERRRWGR